MGLRIKLRRVPRLGDLWDFKIVGELTRFIAPASRPKPPSRLPDARITFHEVNEINFPPFVRKAYKTLLARLPGASGLKPLCAQALITHIFLLDLVAVESGSVGQKE